MTDFILRIIVAGGYWGFALLMALENIFPPIPSEVVMGFGGIAAARGELDFALMVLVGTVGATAGNAAWYWLGARVRPRRLKAWVDRYGRWLTLDWRTVTHLRKRFRDHGGRIVFTFRFLPPFRSLISLPAGIARMPFGRFLLFTFAGGAIWNTCWAAAGYVLHLRFQLLEAYAGWFGIALVAGAVGLYLYRVTTWRPAGATGPPRIG